MKQHEELDATTGHGAHYHFLLQVVRAAVWRRKRDQVHQEYTCVPESDRCTGIARVLSTEAMNLLASAQLTIVQ